MVESVTMPKLAMTQETGTILQWYKSEGETVSVGEPLLEVMTNKVNVEVESYTDGVLLKRLFDEGTEVPVLDVIAYVGELGDAIPDTGPSNDSTGSNAAPACETGERRVAKDGLIDSPEVLDESPATLVDDDTKIRATPAARALARANGVHLDDVHGTGNLGRIHREDVEAFVGNRNAQNPPTPAERRRRDETVASAPHLLRDPQIDEGQANQTVVKHTGPRHEKSDDTTVVPLTEMRRIIGQRMAQSAFQAPHVTLVLEVDLQQLSALRVQLMPTVEQITGSRLSMNTMILKAVAGVLRKHPSVNATWGQGEQIIEHKSVHLGMAVAVANGLIVPVIPDADRLGLAELSQKAKQLSDNARNQKLLPNDLEGGTFTVSNLGMYEIEEFTPIINLPQVAILGVGNIIDKPVASAGEVVIRPQMKLSLSFDHRALDGAQAALFLRDLKHTLETPVSMLL